MNYKYTEIIDYLREEIENDVYTNKLPSIRALAIKFDCSNSTVIRAYNELISMDLVFSAPKSGYFINTKKRNDFVDFDFYSGIPSDDLIPYKDLKKSYDYILNKENLQLLNYSYPMGYNLLREYISLKTNSSEVSLDSVMVTSGIQNSLDIILSNLKEDEYILVEDPTYNILIASLDIKKVKYKVVKRTIESIDLVEMEDILKNYTIKYFFTVSRNHNPLGTDLSENQIKEIIDLSYKYDFYIIEDDYLKDISKGPTFFKYSKEKTIYIRSYSKSISPALRLSYMITPKKLVHDYTNSGTYLNLGASLLNQGVLLHYLKSESYNKNIDLLEDYLKQNIMIYKNAMVNFPYKFSIPECGFYSYIEFPENFALDTLIENLKVKGFLFRKITGFTLKDNVKALRISLVRVRPDSMNDAMTSLVDETLKLKDKKKNENKLYI
ncbi:MAG: PLP-dependent aminotransferase family protein [Clostridium sp.]|nr:PLP-dependent aminotransferase family protein [Clostridium sp.]